jgi:hypothetical protein
LSDELRLDCKLNKELASRSATGATSLYGPGVVPPRAGSHGRYEDLVLSTNLASIERERESIGAGIDANGVRQTNIASDLGLKGVGLRAQNIGHPRRFVRRKAVDT